jgi:hypothetical protein
VGRVRGAAATIPGTRRGTRPLLGIDAAAWRCGLWCGAIATYAYGMLLLVSPVGWDGSDAPLFESVARAPFGDGHHFTADPQLYGVAYRYGRILYPLLAWLLAFGRGALIRPALALLFLAGVVVLGAAAAEIARRCGRAPRTGTLAFAVPFTLVWAGTGVLVSEPVVMALVLLAFLADADGRTRRTRVLAALALLAREATLIPMLALPVRDARRRGLRVAARAWWWVPLPYVAWAVWLRVRIGSFPFTDPSASRRYATSAPFVGIAQAFRWAQTDMVAGALAGIATIVVGALLLRRHGVRSALGLAALLSTASVVCLGPYAWKWLGECLRVLAPTHMLLVLLVVTRGRDIPGATDRVSRPRAAPASAR